MKIIGRHFPFTDAHLVELGHLLNRALKEIGITRFLHDVHLVTPTGEDFPTNSPGTAEDKARHILDQVRNHAGMQDSGFYPVPRGNTEDAPGAELPVEAIPVHYPAHRINNPVSLVAGFVLTLSGYLHPGAADTASAENIDEMSIPEHDLRYRLILCVMLGFGIFVINHAISENRKEKNARTDVPAYPDTLINELVYALAVFTLLKSVAHHEVEAFLQLPAHRFYRKALDSLEKQPQCLEQINGLKTRLQA